jgi:hypothetical protein
MCFPLQVSHADEQLLSSYKQRHHPCFPVLDDQLLVSVDRLESYSALLATEVYASAMIYWNLSPALAVHARPSMRFAWNLAVTALHENYLAPDIDTVAATVLDLAGRPIFSMMGNAINTGRLISLAHSLGLNRNPLKLNIESSQASIRARLWWAVFIHDQWASLAHGTPPHVRLQQMDVPVPTINDVVPDSEQISRSVHCFIALCGLTKILSYLLSGLFDLNISQALDLREINRQIQDWIDSLPEWLNLGRPASVSSTIGMKSLQLSFLMVKLVMSRLELQTGTRSHADCRQAATAIVNFTMTLEDADFSDFWLPYCAYHITAGATVALRYGIEENDDTCINTIKDLTDHLKYAREIHGWDVGDACLSQCSSVLTAILEKRSHSAPDLTSLVQTFSDSQLFNGDIDFNSLFPDIWELYPTDSLI